MSGILTSARRVIYDTKFKKLRTRRVRHHNPDRAKLKTTSHTHALCPLGCRSYRRPVFKSLRSGWKIGFPNDPVRLALGRVVGGGVTQRSLLKGAFGTRNANYVSSFAVLIRTCMRGRGNADTKPSYRRCV